MVSVPAECTTCTHARLADIHRALDAGDGVNATARAFRIAPSTLKLHLKHRKAPAPATEPTVGPDVEPELEEPEAGAELALGNIEGRLRQVARTADRLRREVESGELAPRERAAVLGECRRTIDTMVGLAERFNKSRETAILESPQWAAVLETVVAALQPFPDARDALIEALRQHERS